MLFKFKSWKNQRELTEGFKVISLKLIWSIWSHPFKSDILCITFYCFDRARARLVRRLIWVEDLLCSNHNSPIQFLPHIFKPLIFISIGVMIHKWSYLIIIYMPQLVPFFFVNQVVFNFLLLSIIIYMFSKYLLPRFVRLLKTRLHINII